MKNEKDLRSILTNRTSNLIIGIDFTKSNLWTGKNSYGGLSLHHISPGYLNPYQRVIEVIGKTLEPFDEDHVSFFVSSLVL